MENWELYHADLCDMLTGKAGVHTKAANEMLKRWLGNLRS